MLGPCTTSVTPLFYYCAHIVPMLLLLCPIEVHYCYCCAPTILFLCRLRLYWDPLESYIYKGGLVICIIQEFHLCNVKEVSP